MGNTYKAMNHCRYSCKYHIVWCPKYRRKVIVEQVEQRLKQLIKEYAPKLDIEIIEMETMPDHIHILAELKPIHSPAVIIGRLKGYTSRILRQEFPALKKRLGGAMWTTSYFCSTIGGSPLAIVKKYIEEQKNV